MTQQATGATATVPAQGAATAPTRQVIGTTRGVTVDVVPWSTATAAVELAFGCMFEQEMPGTTLTGGLLALDQALGGKITQLRASGDFPAHEMDTLLVSSPPAGIPPKAIMVIGLGDPMTVTPGLIQRATHLAVMEANRLGVETAMFAPDLLDSGHTKDETPQIDPAMLAGVVSGVILVHRLAELGLGKAATLKNWTFGAGLAHADPVARALSKVWSTTTAPAVTEARETPQPSS